MTYSTAIVPALLVDEAMAHRFFPGEDPIGKRTTVPWGADAEEPSYEVGGAVSSVHHDGPRGGAARPRAGGAPGPGSERG